jgi:putative pyruvate formate lyase activating enzyme
VKSFEPVYLNLLRSGELTLRVQRARELMKECVLCARYCRVDRQERLGACQTGMKARVASFNPHHGEENPLSGWRGSGTIFFSNCNLRCKYCQNHDISQRAAGDEIEPEELAVIMLWLQKVGCHNINFVSPSHVVTQILEALIIAAENGLKVPLVYNTGGFDSLEALELLDGVIDIYMPDIKYGDSKIARRMSKIGKYVGHNKAAVKEMHRQVGDLVLDEHGIAQRGLLIRHLVLPGGMAGSAKVLSFLAEQISPNTYVNIMAQYRPAYRAMETPPFDRSPTRKEYDHVLDLAEKFGLQRLDSRNK